MPVRQHTKDPPGLISQWALMEKFLAGVSERDGDTKGDNCGCFLSEKERKCVC